MKIAQINATCGIGSTGKICVGISELLNESNFDNIILYSYATNNYANGIACSSKNYVMLQALKSKLLGNYGFNSKRATYKMIYQLEKFNPSIVHLHNIHGHDCNLDILFSYFKKKGIKVIWTFHDCWAFTGYCPHFQLANCNKWKHSCKQCVKRSQYSWFFDKSESLFNKKRELFEDLNLIVVTPSHWLSSLVKQSFFKSNKIVTINNGINLDIFKPSYNSDVLIGNSKKVILGVAFNWDYSKGLDVFIDLYHKIDSDKYQIVLVGTNEEVDDLLPEGIISIHRTKSQEELARLYTCADVFVNPTREDTFPTVNIESLACGTPVVTFNTGGSPEIIDETCGRTVEIDDIDSLILTIDEICSSDSITSETCTKRAKLFNQKEKFQEYIKLYDEVIRE